MSHKVLIAGLFHETHTFLDQPSAEEDFAFRYGSEILDARGNGSPIDGVLSVAEENRWEVIPTVDARATPGGIVPDEVFDRFWRGLESGVRSADHLDGVIFVLHGAMVCRGIPDVEGELLRRWRNLPGMKEIPVFAVLDLHANVTPAMTMAADGLVAYRENPHIDAFETGARTARLLQRRLESGRRTLVHFAQPPIILPPSATDTSRDPMLSLLTKAEKLAREHPENWNINVASGFSFADLPETGLSFSVTAEGNGLAARRALEDLCRYAWEMRGLAEADFLSIDEARAELRENPEGLNVLVEPSDNVGAGAPGDGTGIFRLLLEFSDRPSAVALWDPEAVTKLADVPVGGEVELKMGGRGSRFDAGPVCLKVTLESKSDGRFTLEDRNSHLASMAGVHIDMGPSAVVKHANVRILLNSRRTPPFDLGQFRSQGIDPEKLWAIGVKAAVAHRRAYDPIARRSLYLETPGPCSSDLSTFPFRRLRRPIHPLDPIDKDKPQFVYA